MTSSSLQEAGVEIDPLGDLNTESKRKLGQLVLDKYGTEFYILHRYPLAVRPFYTKPCYDDAKYSNSFDAFIRGEEIISGGQRIDVPELLTKRAQECGIDANTLSMSTNIDSLRYGAPPHGGFGFGLEHVVMSFCALDNISKASIFPHNIRSSSTTNPNKHQIPPLSLNIWQEHQKPPAADSSEKKLSKKLSKKLQSLGKRQEPAAASSSAVDPDDPLAANYSDINLEGLVLKEASRRKLTPVEQLNKGLKDETVLIHGNAEEIIPLGKNLVFIVVRQEMSTVQCVLTTMEGLVSTQMIKYAKKLTNESIVEIEGVVSVPPDSIKRASQQVEIHVRKLYCLNRASSIMPLNVEDAARSEIEIEKALQDGKQLVRVNQDTRLNFRFLDIRTPANQGIFRIQWQVEKIFKQFLRSKGFLGIQTPKLIGGSSEGGSDVFRLDYKGTPACLAQSPQLYKQMAICEGFHRVFEVGPVFRAENSFTHRHLCEFTGLDVEMEINEHYSEVMDVVDRLFVSIFDSLNETCEMELEAINRQYPFQKLKYLRKTKRLTFEKGVQMLKEAGVEIDPLGDLNTESERKLGQLVLEKYGTEFYILHRFPLAVRPFYTMPCYDDAKYSNSFDVFIRGEEIISGSQRIHETELLTTRAQECGIDIKSTSISTYIDSFRNRAPRHGGFGAGLERVVMLFCALDNIRKTSLFPRDPHRLAP